MCVSDRLSTDSKHVTLNGHFVLNVYVHRVRKKSLQYLCITLKNVNIFLYLLAQIILRLHFTKILEKFAHVLGYHITLWSVLLVHAAVHAQDAEAILRHALHVVLYDR